MILSFLGMGGLNVFLGLHLKILQTVVLSTDTLVAAHLGVVCVRGECLAFTQTPRRFQLTAAVALAMCGCCTASLNPSLPLPKTCTGTVSKVSPILTHTPPTHTTFSPYFPPLTTPSCEIRNLYGCKVAVRTRWDEGEMPVWHSNLLSWKPVRHGDKPASNGAKNWVQKHNKNSNKSSQ